MAPTKPAAALRTRRRAAAERVGRPLSGASVATDSPPARPSKIHSITSIASSLVCRHHGGAECLTRQPNDATSCVVLDAGRADRRPTRRLLGAATLALIARGRRQRDFGAGTVLDGLCGWRFSRP